MHKEVQIQHGCVYYPLMLEIKQANFISASKLTKKGVFGDINDSVAGVSDAALMLKGTCEDRQGLRFFPDKF